MDTTFAQIIEDHLELKRKNAMLDPAMPLDRYRVNDPFQNHPLFKTEEQAGSKTRSPAATPTSIPSACWPGPSS